MCVEKQLVSMRHHDAPEGARAVAQPDRPPGRAPGSIEWQHSSTSPKFEELLARQASQAEAGRCAPSPPSLASQCLSKGGSQPCH